MAGLLKTAFADEIEDTRRRLPLVGRKAGDDEGCTMSSRSGSSRSAHISARQTEARRREPRFLGQLKREMQSEKTVSFASKARVRPIPKRRNLTDAERQATWYSRFELKQIKADIADGIAIMTALDELRERMEGDILASDGPEVKSHMQKGGELYRIKIAIKSRFRSFERDGQGPLCMRGIEHLRSELHFEQRRMIMDSVVTAVLYEQHRQKEGGKEDVSEIARASEYCSQWCREAADRNGMQDQTYVHQFIRGMSDSQERPALPGVTAQELGRFSTSLTLEPSDVEHDYLAFLLSDDDFSIGDDDCPRSAEEEEDKKLVEGNRLEDGSLRQIVSSWRATDETTDLDNSLSDTSLLSDDGCASIISADVTVVPDPKETASDVEGKGQQTQVTQDRTCDSPEGHAIFAVSKTPSFPPPLLRKSDRPSTDVPPSPKRKAFSPAAA